MPHVIQAAGEVGARIERVVDQLAIVGAGHDSGCVRRVVNGVAPRIRADHLEAVSEAPGHLQRHPMVVRVPDRGPPGNFAAEA